MGLYRYRGVKKKMSNKIVEWRGTPYYKAESVSNFFDIPLISFTLNASRRKHCINYKSRLYVSENWLRLYCYKNGIDYYTAKASIEQ